MTTKDDELYQFDKPHPGESLDAFMKRHRAHPNDPHKRAATPAEEAAVDKTDLYKDQAFVITKK